MTRRSPLSHTGRGKAEESFFGKENPPRSQRLVYLPGAEPGTLDPPKSGDLWETPVIHALFEGLTIFRPLSREAAVALAAQYPVSSRSLRYTLCLRGHPAPEGLALSVSVGRRTPAVQNSGIDVRLVGEAPRTCGRTCVPMVFNASYSGTGCSNPRFDRLLNGAKTSLDSSARADKPAGCERLLLTSMPSVPLVSDTWVYLFNPFVKGLAGDPFPGRMCTDSSVDTNGKPS